MEALKAVLTWLLALCAAGAAVAVPCILAAGYFDDSFTYWLAVVVAAAVRCCWWSPSTRPSSSTSALSSRACRATRCARG